jgi:DNA repair exonuclease SbcCD ATPase subunit
MLSNVSVQIKNFKSIKNKRIELKNGMTLVKGPSGAGKSTALESILYAITGHPRACKPLGTCAATRVQLDFVVAAPHRDEVADERWSIVRSTRPGRLLLERPENHQPVEDDEAQALINSLFGQKFDTVSYIPQNTAKSFMCMTPAAKLEFLESLTFGDDVANVKKKAKAYLKEKKIQVTKAEAEHGVFDAELKSLSRKPTGEAKKIPARPNVDSLSDLQENKARSRNLVKQCRSETDNVSRERRALVHKQRERDNAVASCKTLANELDELKLTLKTEAEEIAISSEPAVNPNDIDQFIKDAKEAENAARTLARLNSSVPKWAPSTSLEKCEKIHETWIKKKEALLLEVADQIKSAENKDVDHFSCPSCHAPINYNRMTKTASAGACSADQLDCAKSVRELLGEESRIHSQIKKRNRDMDALRDTLEKIQNIEDEWGEGALSDLEELEDTVQAGRNLKAKCGRTEKIRTKLASAKKKASLCDDFESDIQKLDVRANVLSEKLDEATDAFDQADAHLEELDAWNRKVDACTRFNEDIQRQKKTLQEAEKKAKRAKNNLDKATALLKGAEELKSAVLKAESLALVQLVNAINDHAAMYLDAFFSDDPIEVSLKTFTAVKSKKKVKPSIQTEILFKGNDMKLDGLSGGECARVVVAFNLALSDIMNTPVLMLDEVTANLDADLAETIFETVSAANAQKIVMAVAHQCVDGTFQNILKF